MSANKRDVKKTAIRGFCTCEDCTVKVSFEASEIVERFQKELEKLLAKKGASGFLAGHAGAVPARRPVHADRSGQPVPPLAAALPRAGPDPHRGGVHSGRRRPSGLCPRAEGPVRHRRRRPEGHARDLRRPSREGRRQRGAAGCDLIGAAPPRGQVPSLFPQGARGIDRGARPRWLPARACVPGSEPRPPENTDLALPERRRKSGSSYRQTRQGPVRAGVTDQADGSSRPILVTPWRTKRPYVSNSALPQDLSAVPGRTLHGRWPLGLHAPPQVCSGAGALRPCVPDPIEGPTGAVRLRRAG